MSKLNNYLNFLQEEEFNIQVAISEITGEFEEEWTKCFAVKCRQLDNKYKETICKGQCQIQAANRAITKIGTIKSKCSLTSNPNSCLNTLKNTSDRIKEKVKNIVKAQAKAQQGLIKFKATGMEV